MTETDVEKPDSEKAADELFHYAIDREDIRWLMEQLHEEAEIDRTAVEYELAALKIVATGWAISFHLDGSPYKKELAGGFWERVFEFSKTLSEATGTLTGGEIDYFGVLKKRLDDYVESISASPEAKGANDPSLAIGPRFAEICGNPDDLFTRMTGMRMFMTNVGRVGEYLLNTGFSGNRI